MIQTAHMPTIIQLYVVHFTMRTNIQQPTSFRARMFSVKVLETYQVVFNLANGAERVEAVRMRLRFRYTQFLNDFKSGKIRRVSLVSRR